MLHGELVWVQRIMRFVASLIQIGQPPCQLCRCVGVHTGMSVCGVCVFSMALGAITNERNRWSIVIKLPGCFCFSLFSLNCRTDAFKQRWKVSGCDCSCVGVCVCKYVQVRLVAFTLASPLASAVLVSLLLRRIMCTARILDVASVSLSWCYCCCCCWHPSSRWLSVTNCLDFFPAAMFIVPVQLAFTI